MFEPTNDDNSDVTPPKVWPLQKFVDATTKKPYKIVKARNKKDAALLLNCKKSAVKGINCKGILI